MPVYVIPALIILASISVALSPLLIAYPELAIGITYDLTLSAPLIYLFLIRKTAIPKTTAVPFFIGGIFIASFILTADQQFHLNLIKHWLLPVVEISLLGLIGFSAYKTVRTYRLLKTKNSDIIKVLQETCQKMLGNSKLADIFAYEIAVLYYAFFSWRRFTAGELTFSYHKKSGKITFFGAIIFILTVETFILHIIVARWNVIFAWILTISSIYIVLQGFAHLKAVYQRPIEIIDDQLFIRYGLFSGTELDLKNIEQIEISSIYPTDRDFVKQVALLGELEQFNTRIKLKQEATFVGFYGLKSKYRTLLLFIDEPEKFKQIIITNDSD